MHIDHVTVLDTEVMSDNTVDTSTAVIEVVVRQHDQNSVLPHLTPNENGVTPEKLQGFHSVVGESNDGVIIVDGISHPVREGYRSAPAISNKPQGNAFNNTNLHQRVRLLLLLEDCCRGVQLLWPVVSICR